MEYFTDKLIDSIRSRKSIVCVGLDPRLEGSNKIPSYLMKKVNNDPNEAIWQFNKAIIDATFSVAAIYKPQMAFYEQYDAINALKKTIDYIHSKNGLVLLDAKRNDIGSTSKAYAITVFDKLKADAVTVNAYLGIDGVKPFLDYHDYGKGVFILLKTSNPSSGEFQDLFCFEDTSISPEKVSIEKENVKAVRNYIRMAQLMVKWGSNSIGNNGYSAIGGVVGATYPSQMVAIRELASKNFLLIPGYGAQGGTSKDVVLGVNNDGLGAIVNASRSIIFAYQKEPYNMEYSPEEFAQAASASAITMQEAINNELKKAGKTY